MKDFVLINFQDNLCEAIPWRPTPCMPAYRPTRSSADCFIIIKLFDGTLAMIQTSVMSVITLHLCTLFNQPRHHFPAPSLRKLLSSKSSSNSDLPFSTILKHIGVPAGNCALFCQYLFDLGLHRCCICAGSLCRRPLQNFFLNSTFNFGTFKQIASSLHLKILDVKTQIQGCT